MRTPLVAAIALVALAAAACGGSTLGSSSNPQPTGSTAVATSGTITAFGSVYVNGVRYDVSRATLKKNGSSVTQAKLAVGEIALVTGSQNLQTGQGSATSVDVEDLVVGPIASIGATSLIVLGQTVNVTATTSFGKSIAGGALSGLAIGDSVEVSGLGSADGSITATRISIADTNEGLQVLGSVAGLATVAHTFIINALTVDYTSAAVTGFTSGAPANGDSVIVRGGTLNAAGTTLTAATVYPAGTDPREDASSGGRVEQEGLVTTAATATDFYLAGAQVLIGSSTVYKGGTVADLIVGARVEVRGTLDSAGVLMADAVMFGHVAALELAGPATAVTTTSVTVLGVAVMVDANTRYEDKGAAEVQLFTLANISVGDVVMIRGYENPAGSGNVLATRVERLAPTTMVEIRGPFTSTTAPQFMILGVTVDASNATLGMGEGQTLTSEAFFAQAVGQIVEAHGTATGSMVVATEVRIAGHGEEDH